MRASKLRFVLLIAGLAEPALLAGCHRPSAEDHLRRADGYLAHSELQEAIVELRLAEQADPKRGDVREKLADAYSRVPDLRSAYREYLRGADLLPDDVHAQLAAGQMLLSIRQFEDARTRAKRVLALDAKNVDGEILLGNALAGLQNLDQAIAEYQDALALDPTRDAAYANMGTIQLVRGQKDQAEASFRKAVEVAPKSVPVRLAFANFLWASGRAPEAERTLKEVLALAPTDPTVNAALGAYYIASNRAQDAEPYYLTIARAGTTSATLSLAQYYTVTRRFADARRVLVGLAAKNNDGYAHAVTLLAALDSVEGQRAQAERRLKDLLIKTPDDMSARLLLARVLAVDDQGDDALKEARSIVTDDPNSTTAASAYLVIGAVQASHDRPEDALAAYEEAASRQSQPVAAEAALSTILLKTGDYYQAETYAKKALEIQPANPALRALKVRAWLAQGKMAQAREEVVALEKLYPNSPSALDLLGAQQLTDRQVEAARATYAKAASLAPGDLEALAGLVRIDLDSSRTKDALARIEEALKSGKPSGELLLIAGRTYASAGDLTKAEEMLQKAIEAEPARLEAYGQLGSVYVAEHRLAKAEDQYRRVTAGNPKSVAAATMLGMILEAEGRIPDAEKQYRAVLTLDDHAAVAANNLAWIYASSNRNLDDGLQLALIAVHRLPTEPHVNDTLGWVYYRKHMTAQAVRSLEASVKTDPTDPTTHYHLGMAYMQAGDTEGAKRSLLQALAMNPDFDGAVEARQTVASIGR